MTSEFANLSAPRARIFFLDVRNDETCSFPRRRPRGEERRGHRHRAHAARPDHQGEGNAGRRGQGLPDGAWALRGDRGLTYAETFPKARGSSPASWWPKDYDGPPLVSFIDDVAEGDRSRDRRSGDRQRARPRSHRHVASLRHVNWRSLGINFVMVFSPNALSAAPHSNLVTVSLDPGARRQFLNRVARLSDRHRRPRQGRDRNGQRSPGQDLSLAIAAPMS